MSDQPLPTSFWSEPLDAPLPAQASASSAEPPVISEIDSWRPSFAMFNTSPEKAMEHLYGVHSAVLNRVVHTFDDAYQHFVQLQAAPVGVQPIDASSAKVVASEEGKARTRTRAAQAPAVEAARVAWKQAVKDKKAAMAQWDAYVESLHTTYTNLRDS